MTDPLEFGPEEHADAYLSQGDFSRDYYRDNDLDPIPARRTNEQLVAHLMQFSRFGLMSQIFIMDSIARMAKTVAQMPIEEVRRQFGEGAMINPDSWHGVATEIHQAIEAHYKS